MPWSDTGVESTIKSLTDMPWLDTGIESGIAIVDSNHLRIVLFFLKRQNISCMQCHDARCYDAQNELVLYALYHVCKQDV